MANEQNLIPQAHKLTVEEQSKGGIASVKARRMQGKMSVILTMALKIGDVPELDEIKSIAELNGLNMDVETAICLQQALKALKKQDTKAAEFCRDTSGQKPKEKIEIDKIDREQSLRELQEIFNETDGTSDNSTD